MSEEKITVYHNLRCSKSRAACEIVASIGRPAQIINYLDTPPSKAELHELLLKLGMKAEALVRKGEETFKQHYADQVLSEDDWLDALVAHPILIERPIVVRGERAVIGRPTEKVQELLAD